MASAAPKEIHEGVLRLCRKIGVNAAPVFVPIIAEPESMPQWCYQNVLAKVGRDGGSSVEGWCIWELPNILVEGEHHAVWKSPDGQLRCISRRNDGDAILLFLPDPRNRYEGLPIGNVRLSWPKNRHTDRWIETLESFERFKRRHTQPYTHIMRFDPSQLAYHQREVNRAAERIPKEA